MPTSVRLSDDLEGRLDALAQRTGRSKAYYIKYAIGEYLADMEDAYMSERRLRDLQAGRSKAIPLEELMARYGVED